MGVSVLWVRGRRKVSRVPLRIRMETSESDRMKAIGRYTCAEEDSNERFPDCQLQSGNEAVMQAEAMVCETGRFEGIQ